LITLATTATFLAAAALGGQSRVVLVATGSSMPESLYQIWNDAYHEHNPRVEIRYLPEGTGQSAALVLKGSGDFGGGDAPISGDQLRTGKQEIIELPTVLIGIVVVYNVPLTGPLKLSGPVLADIFLGKVKHWNDPEIAKLNPDIKLPAMPITTFHRTDGKGSNYIISDFLSKVSPEFGSRIGRSESPKWKTGAAIARSQDLIDKVALTSGAIGYTELNLALKSSLRIASIRNPAGEFVRPSADSIAAAALSLKSQMTTDFRISLTNAPGKKSYPISSYTWLYVPAVAQDPQRGKAIADYIRWVYDAGQRIAQREGYPPLPEDVLTKVVAKAGAIH
jgi:phosphate transport system substrate-binding protein